MRILPYNERRLHQQRFPKFGGNAKVLTLVALFHQGKTARDERFLLAES